MEGVEGGIGTEENPRGKMLKYGCTFSSPFGGGNCIPRAPVEGEGGGNGRDVGEIANEMGIPGNVSGNAIQTLLEI
jgi:hypothetical protein